MNIQELINTHNWNLPDKCPYCKSSLSLNDTMTRLYCPNINCKTYIKARIAKFCAVTKIKELGDATLDKMIDSGIISDISSLFTINYKKLGELIGAGNAKNIKSEIDKLQELSLVDFLTGYNIEDCGSKIIEKILNAKNIDCWEKLIEMLPVADFVTEGVGETTARKFVNGVKSNLLDMKYTLAHGIRIKNIVNNKRNNTLANKSFCFTGKLETMKRSEAEAKVKSLGGEIKNVTKGLTYLVTNDTESGSAKNKKAKELGVFVINEEEFKKLIMG